MFQLDRPSHLGVYRKKQRIVANALVAASIHPYWLSSKNANTSKKAMYSILNGKILQHMHQFIKYSTNVKYLKYAEWNMCNYVKYVKWDICNVELCVYVWMLFWALLASRLNIYCNKFYKWSSRLVCVHISPPSR